jgi:hypothetical protein
MGDQRDWIALRQRLTESFEGLLLGQPDRIKHRRTPTSLLLTSQMTCTRCLTWKRDDQESAQRSTIANR